jgi:catechol 2,3-dioxygenase-like lactoylglutathione lyase family enzyme
VEDAVAINPMQWTLDVEDVERMARFWSDALGYDLERDHGIKLFPPNGSSAMTLWLQPTGTPKRAKNRLHLDFVTDGDVSAEVDRLIALGATHADIGQTADEPFIVLRDPEGNEFCVLLGQPQRRPRTDPTP